MSVLALKRRAPSHSQATYPKRQLEVSVQGQLKRPNKGVIWLGLEIPTPSLELSWMMRGVLAVVQA